MDCRVRCLMVFALVGSASAADAGAETRGVVELFTSQGCSSCPAADRLIGELGSDPSIVAMSLPIDYWDYLGWRDTLASPENSARQRAYARLRGDREVYTPQVVIDGRLHLPGGDGPAILRAIVGARTESKGLPVQVSLAAGGGRLNITVAANPGVGDGEVWLCEIASLIPVKIARGENGGRTVVYHNVVRRRTKLGDWNGGLRRFNLPLASVAGANVDTLAVLVQAGTAEDPGTVLGGALESLRLSSPARVGQ